MATIDQLDIKVKADVTSANQSLSKLSSTLTKMQTSINGLNGKGLVSFANSLSRLSNSSSAENIGNIARSISKLGYSSTTNAIENLQKLAPAITSFASALRGASIGKNAENLTILTKSIAALGYKSAGNAVDNIPKLASALNELFVVLSQSPQVSANTIQMTQALSEFCAKVGGMRSVANQAKSGFDSIYTSSSRTHKGLTSLAAKFGKFYASCFLLIRAFRMLGKAINISSDLTEVENVVNMTFGQYRDAIDDFTKTSITAFGMSELTAKKIASRYQAMGTAMGFTTKKMSEMSVGLTGLAGDMASFYNVEQEVVAEDLEAIFTGQTRPLRQYGLDLTEANLKQWALTRGMNANIDAMTQADKAMLRYEYVMSQTASAQGDFARTSNTWHNQLVILKNLFIQLGQTVGTAFINLLKPVINTLNKIMVAVVNFAETVVNALGAIFGWKLEVQDVGITDAVDDAEDLADATGDAAKNAKELKRQLQGFDELNILNTNDDSSGGGGGGNITGGGDDKNKMFNITETENAFTSEIKTLEQLGSKIGTALTNAMKNIPWDEIYEGARNFGSGLASFLNGLISPELFGAVGETIANSLNTAIYTALEFGKEFNFENFGNSIATGINDFFDNFDFPALAETLNVWVDGIELAIKTALKNITWSDVLEGGLDFLTNLEIDTISIMAIGAFVWGGGAKSLAKGLLKTFLGTELTGTQIGLLVTIGALAFKLGQKLDKIKVVRKITEKITKWLFDGGDELNISKTISLAFTSFAIAGLTATKLAPLLSKAVAKAVPASGISVNKDIKIVGVGLILSSVALTIDNLKSDKVSFGKGALSAIEAGIGTYMTTGNLKLSLVIGTASLVVNTIKWLASQKPVEFPTDEATDKTNPTNVASEITPSKQSQLVYDPEKGDYVEPVEISARYVINEKNGGLTKEDRTVDMFGKIKSLNKRDLTKDQKTVNGMVAKFGSADKSKIENMTISERAKFFADNNSFDSIGNLLVKARMEFTTGNSTSFTFYDANGISHTIYKAKGGVFDKGRWSPISQYASGGVPSHGTQFIAGESGPEIVGHIGGRTEVLNQSQLASTMYSAIVSGMSAVMKNYGGNDNQPIQLFLDGKTVFDSTQQYANDYFNRTGRPAFPV